MCLAWLGHLGRILLTSNKEVVVWFVIRQWRDGIWWTKGQYKEKGPGKREKTRLALGSTNEIWVCFLACFLTDIYFSSLFSIAAAETWRKISVYVCIPVIAVASINAYNLYARHQAHLEHERHEGHEKVKYPYMRLRAKVPTNPISCPAREQRCRVHLTCQSLTFFAPCFFRFN